MDLFRGGQEIRKGREKPQTGGCGSGQEENTENDQEKSDFSEFRPDRFGDGLLLREGKFLRVLRIIVDFDRPALRPGDAGRIMIAKVGRGGKVLPVGGVIFINPVKVRLKVSCLARLRRKTKKKMPPRKRHTEPKIRKKKSMAASCLILLFFGYHSVWQRRLQEWEQFVPCADPLFPL